MDVTIVALIIACSLLIPGLVFRRFKGRFLVLTEHVSDRIAILEIALVGLALAALTVPVYLILGFDPIGAMWDATSTSQLAATLKANWWGILLHCFIVPMLVALVHAYIERKGWVSRLLERIGLVPIASNPSAWGAAFIAHRDVSVLCTVTLNNGDVVYGRFGPDAVATLNGSQRDLYLDALYTPEADGELILDEESTGILIDGKIIQMVVFSDLPITEVDEEE